MLIQRLPSLCFCLLTIFSAHLFAQEQQLMPEPTEEHGWLSKFEGQWETQSKCTMVPGQPPVECNGSLTSRSLGGFWVLNELKGEMAGTAITGIQTLGYDPAKKKYVGTWVDSASTYMWQYEGTVDKSGKILTLDAEGPNFMGDGKLAKFQDVYEFKSSDELLISSRMLGEDGKWTTFMSGTAMKK